MKILSFLFILCGFLLVEIKLQSQPISLMRPADDNHALAIDSADWKFHRMIKEIPLRKSNPGIMLSLGGEIREQLRYYHNVNFGDVDPGVSDRDIYLHQRFMLHADLHVKRYLHVFIQLNSCHTTWKNKISPQVDRDDLGLMQAFAEFKITAPFFTQLRLGRQEFLFGNDRILGLRDGPTVRQTYDGARLTLGFGKVSGDLFLVQPVFYKSGVFDNSWYRKEYVLSTYWSLPLKENNFLDLYYFGVQLPNSTYASDTAHENRHSIGLRISKSKGAFTYDAEITTQFGQFGQQDIRAWQISSLLAYRWHDLLWQPRLLIREALYSGDREQSDGVMNTFRPVSTKSPAHDMISVGSSNLALISPEAEIVFSKEVSLTFRYLAFWRRSSNDGMYATDVRKMTREPDMPGEIHGKAISRGLITEFLVTPDKHVTMWIYVGILQAKEYIQNTGAGKNLVVFSLRAAYKF